MSFFYTATFFVTLLPSIFFACFFLGLESKIYDGFTFFNELELLELRLHQHAPFVDYFILVEARETFRGDPKPLYYELNKDRFKKFNDKIIHIVIDKFPTYHDKSASSFWFRERFQRNQIVEGLKNAKLTDFVIISDADEIIHENVFRHILTRPLNTKQTIKSVEQDLFWFHMNYKYKETRVGSVICQKKHLLSNSCDELRLRRGEFTKLYGGWHFSFLGGGEKIKQKIGAFSEIMFDHALSLDPQEAAKSLFDEAQDFKWVEIDESFPKYVLENKNFYEKIGFISS